VKRSQRVKPERLIQIVKLLALPVFALLVLLLFKNRIAPKEMQLNGTGIKISFYLLQAAERGGPTNKPPETPPNAREIQATAQRASSISLQGTKVLWVDDNPPGQEYERKALGALGVQFILSTSTEDALVQLSKQRFQLVITDFKRADDERAGYTLLEAIMKIANHPPVIIYSSSSAPQFEAEAKAMGAFGETTGPERLFNMAIDAIKGQ
jgi:CheY-like chemotaxis protein